MIKFFMQITITIIVIIRKINYFMIIIKLMKQNIIKHFLFNLNRT